jgi:hypothetical protein
MALSGTGREAVRKLVVGQRSAVARAIEDVLALVPMEAAHATASVMMPERTDAMYVMPSESSDLVSSNLTVELVGETPSRGGGRLWDRPQSSRRVWHPPSCCGRRPPRCNRQILPAPQSPHPRRVD